jgi:hypothetical protein
MRLLPLLAFATILVACSDGESLKRECPTSCFAVPGISEGIRTESQSRRIAKRAGVGICKAGVPVCDKGNFNIIECKGEVLPADEACDGVDNDCNGLIDDELFNVRRGYPHETSNPCLSFGECADGFEVCRDAKWACDYSDTVHLGDELLEHCDGLDNNCDGITDNINLTCTDLLGNEVPCSCYEGPAGTERYGQCRLGSYECINGNIICTGEVGPTEETCDGTDENCNGVVDDTENTLDLKYDIVFVIDASASMCNEIGAVAGAISVYLDQFAGDPNFQWAVVSMTAPDVGVRIEKNFTDITDVQDELLTMGCSQSGHEASYDALYIVGLKNEAALGLLWRDDAMSIVFSFTDEAAQTYFDPETTRIMITDACVENGVVLFQWSNYPQDFQALVESTGGEHFMLVNDWQQILDDLNSVVAKLCIE